MKWGDSLFDGHSPATRGGTVAWSGRHFIGSVGLMVVGEDDPHHGKWVWQLLEVTAGHATMGHVATKAKAALTRAWARWLDERGLVAAEDVARVLRDAMPNRRG